MRLRFVLFFSLVSLVLLAACQKDDGDGTLKGNQQQYLEPFCGTSTFAACSVDADCKAGGCSGQVCDAASAEPLVSTCEFRDCYDAARYEKRCGCVADKCAWS